MKFDMLKGLLALLVLLLSGCTDDLDVTPGDDDAFLAEDFYSTPESYRQGLAGVYANLSITGTDGTGSSFISGIDAGTSQYGRGLWNLQVLSSDEAIWTWENDPGLADIQRSTWAANNVLLRGMYGRTMTEVAFANEYLRQTSDAVLDERGVSGELRANIQVYRAEARFLRALAYYHMLDLFGRAAFLTEDDPVGAFQAPMAREEELFGYVETELLEIIDDMAEPRQNEYGRVDKAAAWMLLAKLYLNAEVYVDQDRYAEALSFSEQVINSAYELGPNYLHLFMADNNMNSGTQEIIFPIVSDGVTTQNFGPTTLMVNGQVGSQETNGEDLGVNAGGWGGALRVPRQFSETFLQGPYTQDDRNTLITEDRTIEVEDISDQTTGYIITKWSNRTSTGGQGADRGLVDTDFPMFRLADAYLMYAEAHLRGGGGSAAQTVEYINALRSRANNPITVSEGELDLDLILDERLVELHWECHRRQDLRRYGLFTGGDYVWSWKGNAVGGISIPDFRAVYPLPSESLAANPNLIQNEGY